MKNYLIFLLSLFTFNAFCQVHTVGSGSTSGVSQSAVTTQINTAKTVLRGEISDSGALVLERAKQFVRDTTISPDTTIVRTIASRSITDSLDGVIRGLTQPELTALIGNHSPKHIYYVSNSGSDANTGKSPSKSWAHHPWMSTWTGSTVLKPGDIICMKRGDVWTIASPAAAYLTVAQSGVTDSMIITTAYGVGNKPSINISTDHNYPVINAANKAYIAFDNLSISHFDDAYDASGTQCGIVFAQSTAIPHNIRVTNCDIFNIPYVAIRGTDDSYNIVIGDTLATQTATARQYSNYIHDCGYAGIQLLGRSAADGVSNFKVYHNFVKNIDVAHGSVDGYGIGCTAGSISLNWPHQAYVRFNRVESVDWTGIDTHGGENMYIQDNYVYDCFQSIVTFAADRVGLPTAILDSCTIERNIIENPTLLAAAQRGIVIAAENEVYRAVHITIKDNTIFSTTRFAGTTNVGISLETCDSTTVEGNYIYNGPSGLALGGIKIGDGYDERLQNVTVRDNYIENFEPGLLLYYRGISGNVDIHNNIVKSHSRAIAGGTGGFTGVVSIHNNTLLAGDIAEWNYAVSLGIGTDTIRTGATLNFKNNIVGFTAAQTTYEYIASPGLIQGTFSCDYNNYWGSSDATTYTDNTTDKNFADWNTAGYDTHSNDDTDPLFKNESDNYTEETDFNLQTTSPCINDGVALTIDYLGTAPDIGAIEKR